MVCYFFQMLRMLYQKDVHREATEAMLRATPEESISCLAGPPIIDLV